MTHELTLLDRAERIAEVAHAGQLRDGGAPYIDHVRRVAKAVAHHGVDAQIVATLHDVVEDSDITLDYLREWFPEHIVKSVDAISRRVCGVCDGEGKVLSEGMVERAMDRVRRVDDYDYNSKLLSRVVGAALADVRDAACPQCHGKHALEPREAYVARVLADENAIRVKIADARDNRDDDSRPGMVARYQWILNQLGVFDVIECEAWVTDNAKCGRNAVSKRNGRYLCAGCERAIYFPRPKVKVN